MRNRLEGKVAIITGAAQGQGAEEARQFVAEGARVMLTDIQPGVMDTAAALGDAARAMTHDVSDEDRWREVVNATVAVFGKLDILVNNAGIFAPGPLEETSKNSFVAHFSVNQLGTFLGMKSVIAAMRSNGGGSIVNISSGAGLRGYPDMISYLSTKWAVTGMTKATARELAPSRIRVNSVHPGLIDTPMISGSSGDSNLIKGLSESVPLGRIGTTTDVSEVVTYLASDLSSFVTGAEIAIDGGTGL